MKDRETVPTRITIAKFRSGAIVTYGDYRDTQNIQQAFCLSTRKQKRSMYVL